MTDMRNGSTRSFGTGAPEGRYRMTSASEKTFRCHSSRSSARKPRNSSLAVSISTASLHLPAALQGLAESHLVRVLEVATHREPAGQPGDPDPEGLEQPGHVHRRGVAFEVRVGGQDDLLHPVHGHPV